MNFEDLRFEVEEATGLLPCVADSLSVLHEELEHNLCPVSYTHLDVYKRQC